MKRWPIIRHVRYFWLRRRMNQHYDMWSQLGYLPVNVERDYAILDRIWEGKQ